MTGVIFLGLSLTAITRSKAWVRVLGVGDDMKSLKQEFEAVKTNDFKLNFRYPTIEQRKHLNIVNRDMTYDDRRRVQKKKYDFLQLLSDLEAGRIYPEDLGPDKLRRLRDLLDRGAE